MITKHQEVITNFWQLEQQSCDMLCYCSSNLGFISLFKYFYNLTQSKVSNCYIFIQNLLYVDENALCLPYFKCEQYLNAHFDNLNSLKISVLHGTVYHQHRQKNQAKKQNMNIGKGFLVCIFKTHTCQALLQSRGNLLDHYDLDSFTPHMNVMLLVQFQHGINYVLLVPNQYTSLSTIFLLVRFFVSSSIK